MALSVSQERTQTMLPKAECEEGLLRDKGGLVGTLKSGLVEHMCSSVTDAGTPGSIDY